MRNAANEEPFGCELRVERLSRVECGIKKTLLQFVTKLYYFYYTLTDS
jgi:hypothetical protein